MPLPLAAAAISAVPAIFQGISGIVQRRKAMKGLNNLKRPEYEIPDEARAALALAEQEYGSNMPGLGLANESSDIAAANAMNAAQLTPNALGAVAMIQAQQQAARRQNLQENLAYRTNQSQRLQGALGVMADQQDKKWQMNEFAPYQDKYNEFREMKGAGDQNIMGALGNLSSLGTMLAARTLPADTVTDAAGAGADRGALSEGIGNATRRKYTTQESVNFLQSPYGQQMVRRARRNIFLDKIPYKYE